MKCQLNCNYRVKTGNLFLELHVPVRDIDEIQKRLPFLIHYRFYIYIGKWVPEGFLGSPFEPHPRLLGGLAAFFPVAVDAAADDVVPNAPPALRTGDDVVYSELRAGKLFRAILAGAAVPPEYIDTVEIKNIYDTVYSISSIGKINVAKDLSFSGYHISGKFYGDSIYFYYFLCKSPYHKLIQNLHL
jgi:hypothetical protein